MNHAAPALEQPETPAHPQASHRLVHVTTVPSSLTFLTGQVEYMRQRGLEVRLVSAPGDDLERFGARFGVPVHAVPMERRITPLRDLVAIAKLVALFRSLRPGIVHAHTPKGGLLGMIAGRVAGVPVRIYHMRGLPHESLTGWPRGLLRVAERLSCRLAQRVVAVGHAVRETAVVTGLCPAEKIVVLGRGSGNGVDAAGRFDPRRLAPNTRDLTRRRHGIPEDAVVVGFVGRLGREKGVVELAKAWRLLREPHAELHLLLVGPVERRDPVPAEVLDELDRDPRVHRTGLDWETPPLYAAMDVVTLPSHREGFPNVPLEAAAMGLPVVASRIPGCEEAVVDGVTGTLVPLGDARALAAALERYLGEPELRRSHGHAGRERALREFQPEAIWRALHDEYEQLVAARRAKGT